DRVYVGEFDDRCNGHGTHTWPSGAVYVGEWKDDKQNGHGKMTYASGSIYEGKWLDGEKANL
ncbi:MORN motif precursor, partial [Amylibacter sp.]|nr:MORN motif precursor [Amylibacter sp.]